MAWELAHGLVTSAAIATTVNGWAAENAYPCPSSSMPLSPGIPDDTLLFRQGAVAVVSALALPLGLLMTRLGPLGQVADEPAHVLKADSLLQGSGLDVGCCNRAWMAAYVLTRGLTPVMPRSR